MLLSPFTKVSEWWISILLMRSMFAIECHHNAKGVVSLYTTATAIAANATQSKRRSAVLAALHTRLKDAENAFHAAEQARTSVVFTVQPPAGAAVRSKFVPSTAPAVTPADWPPRPKTAYSHLSGHLTAGRSASRDHDASSTAGCGARAAATSSAGRIMVT